MHEAKIVKLKAFNHSYCSILITCMFPGIRKIFLQHYLFEYGSSLFLLMHLQRFMLMAHWMIYTRIILSEYIMRGLLLRPYSSDDTDSSLVGNICGIDSGFTWC